MPVFIKEKSLKTKGAEESKGEISEENETKVFPETDLLKRCTKLKASRDGKKVDLLANNNELLGTLNREDDAHCNLDIAGGARLVGRYTTTSTEIKATWSVYETNETKTSKVRIIDEERARRLKGLFNDLRNAAERATKIGKDSVSFRNRNFLGSTLEK